MPALGVVVDDRQGREVVRGGSLLEDLTGRSAGCWSMEACALCALCGREQADIVLVWGTAAVGAGGAKGPGSVGHVLVGSRTHWGVVLQSCCLGPLGVETS